MTTRRRVAVFVGGLLVLLLAAVVAVCITLGIGFPLWGAGDRAQAQINISNCSVNYGALSADQKTNNPAKMQNGVFIAGAIGVPVTQRDEGGIKKELQERRTCGTDGKFDPELTATQYADWSAEGCTADKVAFADIDSFRAQMIAQRGLYNQIETELTNLENASSFSIKSVPVNVWSVYEKPDGNGGLTTHVGTTTMAGTAVVFTYNGDIAACKGKTIEYRLECGFQILRPHQPPGLPVCEQAGCTPCTTICPKDWSKSVPAVPGVTPQPNDPYETRPPAPANPAPVVPQNQTQSSSSGAQGATAPDPNRSTSSAGSGTTSGGSTSTVNGSSGTGSNNTDAGNPFGG